jgi:hypothetical protein
MNWIKENKFLSGFLAVMLVGIGTLGGFLYLSCQNFREVSDNFKKQADELHRLQALTPYPDEDNVKKMRAQKDAYVANIVKLQQELAGTRIPVVPMRPEEFQDNLKQSVNAVIGNAKDAGVKLPEKFYLGFDIYQTTLPKSEAAPLLGQQLKAIEIVAGLLIGCKVDAIGAINRASLPEETVAAAKPAAGSQKNPLVVKSPLTVTFTADQNKVRKFLNELAGNRSQFFILRGLTVKNEKEKGPARTDSTQPAIASAQPVPDVIGGGLAAAPAAPKYTFIVGNEKLTVEAKIEIVDFASPATK